MPFKLRRPNGSPTDLPGEVIHLYQQARDIATAMGKIQYLRPAVLSQIIGDFGEHGLICVERWCARPMTSLDALQNLCEGKEPLVFEKPKQMNEMPGRERQREANQSKTIGKFLGDLKVDPSGPETFTISPERRTSVKRLPEGWMNREMMLVWMRDNHPNDLDLADDFFDYLGVDPKHGPLYKLRVRTSQQPIPQ